VDGSATTVEEASANVTEDPGAPVIAASAPAAFKGVELAIARETAVVVRVVLAAAY